MSAKKTFGDFFRQLRAERRLALREFCLKHGFDPGNISKLERGLLPPPQSEEKLGEYAKALGLKEGSDEWYEFFDLAAASNGKIPSDVLSDKELAAKLPVFFRTLRRQKVSDKKLDDLAERIRRA